MQREALAGADTPKPMAHYSQRILEFFVLVDEGRCTPSDPRSSAAGILGLRK